MVLIAVVSRAELLKSVAIERMLSQYATFAEYSPFFKIPPMNALQPK